MKESRTKHKSHLRINQLNIKQKKETIKPLTKQKKDQHQIQCNQIHLLLTRIMKQISNLITPTVKPIISQLTTNKPHNNQKNNQNNP